MKGEGLWEWSENPQVTASSPEEEVGLQDMEVCSLHLLHFHFLLLSGMAGASAAWG